VAEEQPGSDLPEDQPEPDRERPRIDEPGTPAEIPDSPWRTGTIRNRSAGILEFLETIGLRESRESTGLDARTFALVRIAALIALDAPLASYAWQISTALEEGVSADDIVDVLRAVAPQVGGARVVAAAAEIMQCLGG
jgi:4-carboxymuconolactone decarboxylase